MSIIRHLRKFALSTDELRLQALSMLTSQAKETLVEPAQAYLARMEASLGQDCEALTDGGRDRTFVSASSSLLRVSKILAECDSNTRADQLVRV